MTANRLFNLLIVVGLLVVTACAPQVEQAVTDVPTVAPKDTATIGPTVTPTIEPTVTPTIAPTATAQPTEAAIGSAANLPFPSGKFFYANDPTAYFTFKDGRWAHSVVGMQFALATGTYRVEGNTYFQLTNSGGCPPMSFKYSFDGRLLKFQLTEESKTDTCGDRKDFYNNKTYILSE